MAKQSYKVPAGLNQTFADMEISIKSDNGIGFKPLPLKVVLVYVFGIILGVLICSKTFISTNGVYVFLFGVVWLIALVLLGRYDKTKRMQLQMVPLLLAYLPRSARRVVVRKSLNNAAPMLGICPIADIDPETDVISFSDGSVGYMYRVVGSASILLFDEDRDAILSRVDSFYRKIGTECEIIFVTAKEAQKIYRQVANLKRRYDRLDTDDDELRYLAEEQFSVLKDYIGGSFRSIHQYMIIKADNKEMLTRNANIVQAEYENSSLMFKQCLKLGASDMYSVLRTIYS